jgi:amino-acid N-acetyltransferase
MTTPPSVFSEREFYLQEFRGRTLAIACAGNLLRDPSELARVVASLVRGGARAVVISSRRPPLEAVAGERVLPAGIPSLEAAVWRSLRRAPRLGLLAGGRRPFPALCRELALRLRVSKLIWIDPGGGVRGRDGERRSFLHHAELRALLSEPRRRGQRRVRLLREVDALLEGGIPAVNVCTLEGLERELFTYAGSGTLFTRERYIHVRDLGLDDFDAAHDLIARGVEEGYLAARSSAEVDQLLASGFGAFVEGRHLAGIGALLPHAAARAGEIAALYTLTRFLGEGVGGHLLSHALRRARDVAFETVFACTTSNRVGAFFERYGFEAVGADALPSSKWRGYDAARRRRLLCFQRRLGRRSAESRR